MHPTFHASHLKASIRHLEFEQEVEPPPPVLMDDELEYEVEATLHHRGKGPNIDISSYGRATHCQKPHGNRSLISSMLQTF